MSLFGKGEPTVPLAFHEAAMATERARYDALLDKFTALRVQGAVPEPAVPEQRMAVPSQPDELRELIDAKAGTDLRRRKMMLRQLTADRAAGVSDDDIREAIENGVTSDGVPG